MELLTPQPAGAHGRRWTARASSVAGIEAELARIWSSVADEMGSSGHSRRELAEARGSPQLTGRLDESRDVRVRTRTSVLTLVVVAPRPETTERALDAINLLASRHPSRAIVVAPGDPDGPSTLDAQIFAQCHLAERGTSETCTEQILLRTGGEIDAHLRNVVAPLLIHDLPVVIWWPDDPPIGSRQFSDLVELCDRLLVDSGAFRDDGTRRLSALAAVVSGPTPIVYDIGWMRLTLWRELLAGLFEHPLLTPELEQVQGLRIDVARPGELFRLTKAACFTGWLADRLDWELVRTAERRRGSESLFATYRQGRHDVRVELRPVSTDGDRALRSAGSLVRVELTLGRRGHDLRARVARQADHLLATADWDGAQVARRAGRLEPFGEAPFLAEALHSGGKDRIFEGALARATRLLGG
ncbi:MAG TPA: glucose-6-phosphate dehydrogenase assembly protein OpcA [Candidatus Limnocylindrales bacterium]|nr:glucose-6-phosphate dehydrogenase assembly protein OpcA [Candidatus Limnocylindrales bacterium]